MMNQNLMKIVPQNIVKDSIKSDDGSLQPENSKVNISYQIFSHDLVPAEMSTDDDDDDEV